MQGRHYFFRSVQYLASQEVLSGYHDGTFRPFNNASRAQAAKMVVLGADLGFDTRGGPHFNDVPADNPFYRYVETAYNRGFISGHADGSLSWYEDITRGELAKMVVLATGWEVDSSAAPRFRDVPRDNPFYPFVETAAKHEMLTGYPDGTFRPFDKATRGEVAHAVFQAVVQPWTGE